MTKTSLKSKIISILAVLFCLSIALSVFAFTAPKKAMASTSFAMVEGASIRLDDDNTTSGIKYTATIDDADWASGKYYFLIIPTYLLSSNSNMAEPGDITLDGDIIAKLEAAYSHKEDFKLTIAKAIKARDGLIEGSIVNIPEKDWGDEFFGIAYYVDGETGDRVYASFDADTLKVSISDVAENAYLDKTSNWTATQQQTLLNYAVNAETDDLKLGGTAYKTVGANYSNTYVTTAELVEFADGVVPSSDVANSETAVKYTVSYETSGGYFAASAPINLSSSGMWKAEYSALDTSKSIVRFKIYFNGSINGDLYVGLVNSAGVYGYDSIEGLNLIIHPLNLWQTVEFKLSDFDVNNTENLYVVVRNAGSAENTTYEYYIDGFEVVEVSGDADDVGLKMSSYRNLAAAVASKYAETTTELVEYSGSEGLTAPEGLTDSTTAIKHTVTLTDDVNVQYWNASVFGNFVTAKAGYWNDNWSALDNTDSYLGFWIKINVPNYTSGINVGLVNSADMASATFITGASKKITSSDEWQYVEFPLTEEILDLDAENKTVYLAVVNVSHNERLAVGDRYTYYIDGVNIFGLPAEASDRAILVAKADTGAPNVTVFPTTAEAVDYADLDGIPAPYGLASSEGGVKYSLGYLEGATGNKYLVTVPVSLMNSKGYWTTVFSSISSAQANAYVGFWVYNNYASDLTFGLCQSYSNNSYPRHPLVDGANVVRDSQVATKGSWTYIEFSFATVDTTYFVGGQNRFYISASCWGASPTEGQTLDYYIDGFGVYLGSKIEGDNGLVHSFRQFDSAYGNAPKFPVTAEVVNYADLGISAPEGLEATTAVKYSLGYKEGANNKYLGSIPINLHRDGGMWKAEYDTMQRANAYVGFWVYNINYATSLSFGIIENTGAFNLVKQNGGTNIKAQQDSVGAKGQWVYVELSLANIAAVPETDDGSLSAVGNTMYIYAQSGWEASPKEGATANYLIAGFSVYEGSKLA